MPRRVDKNQRIIVEGLRTVGATVLHLHKVGHGCPDILVGLDGKNWLFEIKADSGKLGDDQIRFHESWCGQVAVIRNLGEALVIMGLIKLPSGKSLDLSLDNRGLFCYDDMENSTGEAI